MTRTGDTIPVILAVRLTLVRAALGSVIREEPDLRLVAEPADGFALLEAARWATNGVALVDTRLRGLDGIAACAAIRAEELPLRVVVVSDDTDRAVLLDAVESGADGYLSHDASLKELLEAIRRVHTGEAWVPSAMLGTLLADLIRRQRAEKVVAQRAAGLTKRELQVLALLVDGLDHRAIAEELVVSPHTARTHIQNVMDKLGAHSRLEVARLAVEHNLIERRPYGTGGTRA